MAFHWLLAAGRERGFQNLPGLARWAANFLTQTAAAGSDHHSEPAGTQGPILWPLVQVTTPNQLAHKKGVPTVRHDPLRIYSSYYYYPERYLNSK